MQRRWMPQSAVSSRPEIETVAKKENRPVEFITETSRKGYALRLVSVMNSTGRFSFFATVSISGRDDTALCGIHLRCIISHGLLILLRDKIVLLPECGKLKFSCGVCVLCPGQYSTGLRRQTSARMAANAAVDEVNSGKMALISHPADDELPQRGSLGCLNVQIIGHYGCQPGPRAALHASSTERPSEISNCSSPSVLAGVTADTDVYACGNLGGGDADDVVAEACPLAGRDSDGRRTA